MNRLARISVRRVTPLPRRRRLSLALPALLFGLALAVTPDDAGAAQAAAAAGPFWVFVGTYTQGGSEGIYRFEFDPATGKATEPELAAETVNPTFLAIHPSQGFLYAANEIGDYEGEKAGSISAYKIDRATGALELLNSQSSKGDGPCHLVVDSTGKNVLVANYGGGSVAVLPIEADGRLAPASDFKQHEGSGADSRRQSGPHAHSINLDAANKFAAAADLGLDQVLVYAFDADQGTLKPNTPPFVGVAPAAGPRHFAFHPDGKHAYVINEMNSTITAFDYDSALGVLSPIETFPTLPADFEGNNSTADVQVHPSGRFVFGSNRGHHSIAIFAVDPETGRLRSVGHQSTGGETPRNFGIDPTGSYLLAENQGTDNIVIFRIDAETGELDPTGEELRVVKPVCIKFVPKAAE